MMKKTLLMITALAVLVVGCKKPDNMDPQSKQLEIELSVTGIENNSATISVTVTSGVATEAKIIEAIKQEEVTIDAEKDIQLINFIENNGEAITLPYTKTLTDVPVGKDLFTAVVVYNKEGRAEICKYLVWTPEGDPDGWSTENNPGALDEIKWN